MVATTSVNYMSAWKSLGLLVIDEQHKFGVRQREKVRGRGAPPHRVRGWGELSHRLASVGREGGLPRRGAATCTARTSSTRTVYDSDENVLPGRNATRKEVSYLLQRG